MAPTVESIVSFQSVRQRCTLTSKSRGSEHHKVQKCSEECTLPTPSFNKVELQQLRTRVEPLWTASFEIWSMSSVSSIGKLLHDSNAGAVFRALCSLLIGALSPDQPVQIAHSSLRYFITRCNQSGNSAHARFAISGFHHSQRLALYCIVVLNNELSKFRTSVAFILMTKGSWKYSQSDGWRYY